jgi:AcrR family transcriptional regulator
MSNSATHIRAAKRPYRLGKRAQKQEETRRRIVEAAVDLHSTLGPAHTTVAQIADRAGVQRHTYYAHFPKEWDLLLACSSLALERDPLPDPEQLRPLPKGRERIAAGLEQLYGWFSRNRQQAACVLRDAEHHQPTREIVQLRMAPMFAAAREVMSEGLGTRSLALLNVALEFVCWRTLSPPHSAEQAAALMADAIVRVGEWQTSPTDVSDSVGGGWTTSA